MICFQGDNHLDEKYRRFDVNKHKVNIIFASRVIIIGKQCKNVCFFIDKIAINSALARQWRWPFYFKHILSLSLYIYIYMN